MILVTGATGMLGSHLLFQLVNSNEKLRAIYRTEKSLKKVKKIFGYYTNNVNKLFLKINWVKADIIDIPSLESAFIGIKTVYHTAALVSFDPADYKKMRTVNISGTANIVNLCIDYKIKKLVFVSSIASISKNEEKQFIDEQDEFNINKNNDGYAISKYGAELEVWRGAQEGLDVVILNPGVILGPGFWNKNSGNLFSMIYKGFPFYTEKVTGFVGVYDVVKILIKSMKSKVVNERFILVAENKNFKEILFCIANNIKVKVPKIKINYWMVTIAHKLSWIKSKMTNTKHKFTKNFAKSINNKHYYKGEKAKKTFDFEFETIEKVISKTCSYFLSDKENNS